MSIHDLKQRLFAGLDQFKSNGEISFKFRSPLLLEKQLLHIEKKYSDLEDSQPQYDRILESIDRLKNVDLAELSNSDWKNIAWGLCAKFEERPQSLIATDAGHTTLLYFNKLARDMSGSLFIALLVSYFSLESSERDQVSKNWLLLRKVLNDAFPRLMSETKRPRDWMTVIQQYPELLQDNPTRRLSTEFLDSPDDKLIPNLVEQLRIPTLGWFWKSLVKDAVQSVCNLDDSQFLLKIDRLVLLREKLTNSADEILESLLDRYAESSMRTEPHLQLKTLAIESWGNPQSSNSASWNNKKPDTRAMMVSWFVMADLQAFFDQFAESAVRDRFDYWKLFLNQISDSQILLGRNARISTQPEHLDFKQQNTFRFGYIKNAASAETNSFILKIGPIYIVEFSDMGAAFIHLKNPMTAESRFISIEEQRQAIKVEALKAGGKKFRHTSSWQVRIDAALAQLGIFPDKVKNPRRQSESPSQPTQLYSNYKRL